MRPIAGIASIIVVLCLLDASDLAHSKRLLIITPAPSYSHQIVFRALCLALHKRGHEIVVLTPNILNDPTLTNYTEIDFGFEYEKIDDTDFSQMRWNLTQLGGLKTRLLRLGHDIAEDVLSHPDLVKYYANGTNERFDVVIAEMIMTPAIYMLAHQFNAPLIGKTRRRSSISAKPPEVASETSSGARCGNDVVKTTTLRESPSDRRYHVHGPAKLPSLQPR